MGEYFYVNDIDFEQSDFLNLRSRGGGFQVYTGKVDQHKLLIPISGGKDSIVTIELLNDSCVKRLHAWCLNPTRQMLTVVKTTKVHGPLVVRRAIDPKLLQLNSSGYLNGHTPFSAYLAFASIVSAVLGDFGAVVVSHERSSNEGNVLYRGRIINHQYSKSYQFEKKFRDYLNRYLAGGIDYFSLLRPLYELQIAGIFSKFPKYFSLVKSCNRGLRTNTWCHKCPKCVFVFASLYPFIETSVLTSVIFSRNLFEDEKLADLAFQLLTKAKVKPFECVGTREETLIAFNLCIDKAIKTGLPLPQVLTRVSEKILIHEKNLQHRTQAILSGWTNEHQVPENLGLLVKKALWL